MGAWLAIALALSCQTAAARPLALGLEAGEASGVSAGYSWSDRHQVNALLGYSAVFESLVVRTDYVFHFWRWSSPRQYGARLSVFGGAGGRLGLFEPRPRYLRETDFALGPRLPLGVVATMPPLPFEVVLTLAPGFDALPVVRPHVEAGLALRLIAPITKI
ncbi:MAG: hypothetical protein JXR83_03230 [Deltaproteobacteria bacterium]|nr:hypothetical protein [Deltaproteobacteria bacterium]